MLPGYQIKEQFATCIRWVDVHFSTEVLFSFLSEFLVEKLCLHFFSAPNKDPSFMKIADAPHIQ